MDEEQTSPNYLDAMDLVGRQLVQQESYDMADALLVVRMARVQQLERIADALEGLSELAAAVTVRLAAAQGVRPEVVPDGESPEGSDE